MSGAMATDLFREPHNPAAKFLRELNLSVEDAQNLDILALLQSLPRKERTKYGKRKQLSAEQRSELTKKRNREHARSTRMRKKMVMEALQVQVDELQKKLEPRLGCRKAGVELIQQQTRRQQNLATFFSFCSLYTASSGGGCQGSFGGHSSAGAGAAAAAAAPVALGQWSEILVDSFTLTAPSLPSEGVGAGRPAAAGTPCASCGIDALMRDLSAFPSKVLAMLAGSGIGIGDGNRQNAEALSCSVVMDTDEASVLLEGDRAMCGFHLRLRLKGPGLCRAEGAAAAADAEEGDQDGPTEVSLRCMAKLRFAMFSDKVVAVDLRYDVLALAQLLEEATGRKIVAPALQQAAPLPFSHPHSAEFRPGMPPASAAAPRPRPRSPASAAAAPPPAPALPSPHMSNLRPQPPPHTHPFMFMAAAGYGLPPPGFMWGAAHPGGCLRSAGGAPVGGVGNVLSVQ